MLMSTSMSLLKFIIIIIIIIKNIKNIKNITEGYKCEVKTVVQVVTCPEDLSLCWLKPSGFFCFQLQGPMDYQLCFNQLNHGMEWKILYIPG